MTNENRSLDLPAASLEMLRERARLLNRMRAFFDDRKFFEVQTPALSADTVVDQHLDPFEVRLFQDPRDSQQGPIWYLQTSPEFHMKRIMAAGAEAIYQISNVFRAAESGSRHNPEFTMVEWYRRGDDMQQGINLLDSLCQHMLGTPPAEVISYAEAFERHAGINPHNCDDVELESRIEKVAVDRPQLESRDDRLNFLLTEAVEANLGRDRPTIVFDYPASQSALAITRSTNSGEVAERFELYVQGVELANGYHELGDADEMERRFRAINKLRAIAGKQELPVKNRLASAMRQGFPDCAGVALGFDRLVMLATGAEKLSEVLAFPVDRS